MKQKFFCMLIVFLFYITICKAQEDNVLDGVHIDPQHQENVFVKALVLDAVTQMPLSAVKVLIKENEKQEFSLQTDTQGNFSFVSKNFTNLRISYSKPGYNPAQEELQVPTNKDTLNLGRILYPSKR